MPTPPESEALSALSREDIVKRVKELISYDCGVPAERITDESTLEGLGVDSLESLELVMALEDEFDIEINDATAECLTSVDKIVHYLQTGEYLPAHARNFKA